MTKGLCQTRKVTVEFWSPGQKGLTQGVSRVGSHNTYYNMDHLFVNDCHLKYSCSVNINPTSILNVSSNVCLFRTGETDISRMNEGYNCDKKATVLTGCYNYIKYRDPVGISRSAQVRSVQKPDPKWSLIVQRQWCTQVLCMLCSVVSCSPLFLVQGGAGWGEVFDHLSGS